MSIKRILVVDDDEALLMLLSEALDYYGFETFSAGSAEVALEILKGIKVDGVLSDFMMPGLNGREFAEICLAKQPGVPIIIITGADIDPTLFPENVTTVIRKPIDIPLLVQTLGTALSYALRAQYKARKIL